MLFSAEAPVVFAKACELFILDLTLRAWEEAEGKKVLQHNDVSG